MKEYFSEIRASQLFSGISEEESRCISERQSVQYPGHCGPGRQGKCRPFMFAGELEGKLWFCTNNQKDVYKDMQADPFEIEISVSSPEYAWIRLHGRLGKLLERRLWTASCFAKSSRE